MQGFFTGVYYQVSEMSLLDSLRTGMLKQYYRMFTQPLHAWASASQGLDQHALGRGLGVARLPAMFLPNLID